MEHSVASSLLNFTNVSCLIPPAYNCFSAISHFILVIERMVIGFPRYSYLGSYRELRLNFRIHESLLVTVSCFDN